MLAARYFCFLVCIAQALDSHLASLLLFRQFVYLEDALFHWKGSAFVSCPCFSCCQRQWRKKEGPTIHSIGQTQRFLQRISCYSWWPSLDSFPCWSWLIWCSYLLSAQLSSHLYLWFRSCLLNLPRRFQPRHLHHRVQSHCRLHQSWCRLSQFGRMAFCFLSWGRQTIFCLRYPLLLHLQPHVRSHQGYPWWLFSQFLQFGHLWRNYFVLLRESHFIR